jgi:hypothetical protein
VRHLVRSQDGSLGVDTAIFDVYEKRSKAFKRVQNRSNSISRHPSDTSCRHHAKHIEHRSFHVPWLLALLIAADFGDGRTPLYIVSRPWTYAAVHRLEAMHVHCCTSSRGEYAAGSGATSGHDRGRHETAHTCIGEGSRYFVASFTV